MKNYSEVVRQLLDLPMVPDVRGRLKRIKKADIARFCGVQWKTVDFWLREVYYLQPEHQEMLDRMLELELAKRSTRELHSTNDNSHVALAR